MNSSTPRVEMQRDPAQRGWEVHINRVDANGQTKGVALFVPDNDNSEWRVSGPLTMVEGVSYSP